MRPWGVTVAGAQAAAHMLNYPPPPPSASGVLQVSGWSTNPRSDRASDPLPPQMRSTPLLVVLCVHCAASSASSAAGSAAGSAAAASTFNFTVSDGGGFTLTVGNWTEDGRSVLPPAEATFTLQSQFSEPGAPERWTTLQPPWGGVPANFMVDRSGEAEGRTVVRLNGSYDGLWSLERVYQVAGHRVLVNDTLTARHAPAQGGGPSALAIYLQHILAAEAIGSVKDVVIPGSLGTYDCDNYNDDRGSFGAPQIWMATASAAVAMMPLDDTFRVHSLARNAALAKYPTATTERCAVSAYERPTIVLADPHLGLAPGANITLEWAIYPVSVAPLAYILAGAAESRPAVWFRLPRLPRLR
eukprot:COSAG04_NODE_2015_length_4999_cov_3.122245_3_plen_357_part_00